MPMTRLALLRRVALAALIAPAVLGAQASAYTLEDIVGMLKNRVPQRRIIDLAARRCVDFVVDSRSEARLKETGAGASFVDELKEAIYPQAIGIHTTSSRGALPVSTLTVHTRPPQSRAGSGAGSARLCRCCRSRRRGARRP